MKVRVIDASVAIKWFVTEESKYDEAMAILDSIQDDPEQFAVPELFFNEMLSVFCKLLSDDQQIQEYLKILEGLGLRRIGNGSELLGLAATIATKQGLTGYDAVYAAAAKLIEGQWLTADAKAHKRIASLKVSVLL
jgi:predicted nucleic acid-binding protein